MSTPEGSQADMPPSEIIKMAMKIERWFQERGIDRWELMGICSRNYADDQKKLPSVMSINERLTQLDRDQIGMAGRIDELEERIQRVYDCEPSLHRKP